MEVTKDELIQFYSGKIDKWRTPDEVAFMDSLPIGATGKVLKDKIRESFKDYKLDGVKEVIASLPGLRPVAGSVL